MSIVLETAVSTWSPILSASYSLGAHLTVVYSPVALFLRDNLFLHHARLLVQSHGGELPACRVELEGVPGIDGLEALVPAYLCGGGKRKYEDSPR